MWQTDRQTELPLAILTWNDVLEIIVSLFQSQYSLFSAVPVFSIFHIWYFVGILTVDYINMDHHTVTWAASSMKEQRIWSSKKQTTECLYDCVCMCVALNRKLTQTSVLESFQMNTLKTKVCIVLQCWYL